MNIDKDTLLNLLHSNGQHSEADQAAAQLPDQVDTDHHAGLLSNLGVDLPALMAKFTGGGAGGAGLGGLLGGLGGGHSTPADPAETSTAAEPNDAAGPAQTGGGLGGLLDQFRSRS